MLFHTHALGRSYLDNSELPELLRQLENYEPLPYADPANIATIGIGINIGQLTTDGNLALVLQYLGVFAASDAQAPGSETLEQKRQRYLDIIQDFRQIISDNPVFRPEPGQPSPSPSEAALRAALDDRVEFYGAVGNFEIVSEADAKAIKSQFILGYSIGGLSGGPFTDNGAQARLDQLLINNLTPIEHDTREYMALMSLYFNNPDLVGGGLRRALARADPYDARAEAWYEIRYVHANQLHKRRFVEAGLFGLYGEGVPAADAVAQAQAIYRMYARHGRAETMRGSNIDMVTYETTFAAQREQAQSELNAAGFGAVQVQALKGELTPAATTLKQRYITDAGITGTPEFDPLNIQVAYDASGLVGEDTITRTGFNTDLLIGRDGPIDVLNGQGGSDMLVGLGGDDYLIGGQGDDVLVGGEGYDTYVWNTGDGNDRIIDSDRRGRIIIDSQDRGGLLAGGYFQKIDATTWRSADGYLTLTHNSPWKILVTGGGEIEIGDTFASGDFSIHLLDQPGSDTAPTNFVNGTDFNDDGTEQGGETRPVLTGDVGADEIHGFLGNDILDGQDGEDRLFGDEGGDILFGGLGDDTLQGGTDGDILLGFEGNDTVVAEGLVNADIFATMQAAIDSDATPPGAIKEFLGGGGGNDISVGGTGNDALSGGLGIDTLIGGAGNDSIWGDAELVATSLNWSVDGLGGFVNVSGTIPAAGVGEADSIYAGGGDDSIAAEAGDDYVDAGAGNDRVIGHDGHDTIFGGSGDDILDGDSNPADAAHTIDPSLHGDDYLDGEDGNDELVGNGGADTLFGGTGNDTLIGDDSIIATVYHGGDYLDGEAGDDQLFGNGGADTLFGGDGIDIAFGDAGDDYLDGGAGADQLSGGEGADTIFGGAGMELMHGDEGDDYLDGEDDDDQIAGDGGNDVIFGGLGNDTVTGNDGDDSIDGEDGNDVIAAGAGNDSVFGSAGLDELQGGDGDDTLDGGFDADRLFGEAGLDTLIGDHGNDELTGGAGADTIEGGDGDDQIFGDGDAVALVDQGADFIYGGAGDDGIRGYGGDDQLFGEDGSDTIYGEAGADTIEGAAGNDFLWGDRDVAAADDGNDTLLGGDGDDQLVGYGGDDTLAGGTGNDTLFGYGGNDTYLFNLGDGRDLIVEDSLIHTEVLRFGPGIVLSDLTFSRVAGDLVVSHANGTDEVTIASWYAGTGFRMTRFEFPDGSQLSGTDAGNLGLQLQRGTEGSDIMSGSSLNDTLYGLGGNDTIFGIGGADTLIGGTGNDTLNGGDGADTFRFELGDGQDHIQETGLVDDTLIFGAAIASTDISYRRVGTNLEMSHVNGTDKVTVEAWYTTGTSSFQLQSVRFESDGTVLDTATLGTRGMVIDDQYTFNAGNGAVLIEDWGGTDTLTFAAPLTKAEISPSRVGQDLVLTRTAVPTDKVTVKDWFNDITKQIETVNFAAGGAFTETELITNLLTLTGTSGNDILAGGNAYGEIINGLAGDDIITGGAGNDLMTGGTGNDAFSGGDGKDRYFFRPGDGQDRIGESGELRNVVQFAPGMVNNAVVTFPGTVDKLITFTGSTDSVRVVNSFTNVLVLFMFELNGTNAGETILGTDTEDWGDVIQGLDGNDTINGRQGPDEIYGGAGNDNIQGGHGDFDDSFDWLYGEAGDDILDGGLTGSGVDVGAFFTGGTGNDQLFGGSWLDHYYFNVGDGNDTITDESFFFSATHYFHSEDDIIFGLGITQDSISARFEGPSSADLRIQVTPTDSILVKNWTNILNRVDFLRFADGTSMNDVQIDQLARTIKGTAGNDTLTGTSAADTILGLGGNDTISSLAGDDQLTGGTGDDGVQGGDGNDTYFFNLGDGRDTITETSGTDTLRFGAGITASAVTLGRNGNSLLLTVNGSDSVTIANYMVNAASRVENFVFTDGSSLPSEAQILDQLLNIRGTTGDDVLTGTSGFDAMFGFEGNDTLSALADDDQLFGGTGNDTLAGGQGNDTLLGEEGDDLYQYALGDGQDLISDASGFDAVAFGSGIAVTEVATTRSSSDLVLNVNDPGNPGRVTVQNYFNGEETEEIRFFDGTIWDVATVRARVLAASSTSGNDTILGYDSDDTINALAGNDTVYGFQGNDFIDGGSGIDVMYGGTGNDTYVIDNASDQANENPGEGIDTIRTNLAWTLGSNLENLTITGTSNINGTGNQLDNTLIGNTGRNTLNGGAGNDWLEGGGGRDTFIGGTGDDTFVVDGSDTVTELVNEGIDTVQSSITYTLGADVENLTLTGTTAINATGNALNNVLTGNSAANTLTGGSGNDIYFIGASDSVVESASSGEDLVSSSVTHTLAANVEHLILTGPTAINGTGNGLNNLLRGNSATNTLDGAAGNDMLEGGDGDDTLSDTGGANLLNGQGGIDTLTGNSGNELFAGGAGNDEINTGAGADNIAFNRGEGTDTVAVSTVKDNAVSLGGGIAYADLFFEKSGNNLVLKTAGSSSAEGIAFTDWYAAAANRSVLNMQVIVEASADFDAGSADPLRNKKVAEFNFDGLVSEFDAALAANPSLTTWALTNALVSFHLSGSDTAALGGDLAYQHGRFGNLANVGTVGAQNVLGGSQFGSATQTFQSLPSLQEGVTRLT